MRQIIIGPRSAVTQINGHSQPIDLSDGSMATFYASNRNRKTGPAVLTFSKIPGHAPILDKNGLPVFRESGTCPAGVPCESDCYACNACKWKRNIEKSMSDNTRLIRERKFLELADYISARVQETHAAAVRIHDFGDFESVDEFRAWISIAIRNLDVQFLAFTKNYGLLSDMREYGINGLADVQDATPNFTVVVSLWESYPVPYWVRESYPVAMVREHGIHENMAHRNLYKCSGRCSECFACWKFEPRDGVIFDMHE